MTRRELLREPVAPDRLNGSGLLVVNPTWRFEDEALAILAALAEWLTESQLWGGFQLLRVVSE